MDNDISHAVQVELDDLKARVEKLEGGSTETPPETTTTEPSTEDVESALSTSSTRSRRTS